MQTKEAIHLEETGIEKRVDELLGQMTLKEKILLLSGRDTWFTIPIPRLGIPSIAMTDGPHGVRTADSASGRKVEPTTCFPTGVSMSASWNTELIERVAAALGEETRAEGCNILLGPCVNIVRTPIAGRNFESYSEDPYLAGRIGVAWVKGIQSQQIGASLKHFACNNQETERHRSSSEVDERTLREIYLPAFETIVKEAKPWTVMCSYNRINGVYASQNHYLLKEILKGEWGFEGLVVSDWGANHTIFESVQGGLDLEMPGPAKYYGRLLMEAAHNWQIEEPDIDDSARRILRIILRSGMMDKPGNQEAGSANTPEHQALARELAEEAITLLKNDGNFLPLDLNKVKSIAVIGPNAAEGRIGGGGSSFVEPPYQVSPLDGLKNSLGNRIQVNYEIGCDNYVEPPLLKADYVMIPDCSAYGLKGEYFNNLDFSGKADFERIDDRLDFSWWGSSPAPDINRGNYSVRWTGKLMVPESGLYTLSIKNTGLARIYINDELFIENIGVDSSIFDEAATTSYGLRNFTAGNSYDIRLEFTKLPGQEFAHLRLCMAYSPKPEEDERFGRAVELARHSDLAIVFAGMPTGYETEGWDRPDIELPGRQNELIRAITEVNPRTVVVLNAGAPVTLPWLDSVPAVIEAYYPGMEGGNAVARVLTGEVNPSGKLPVTFPMHLEDTPAFTNQARPGTREILYGEGIFVGYRYYDARDIEPLYPFGYGLSYTTFEYLDIQAPKNARAGEPVVVSVSIKNTGKVTGKEVVQLYVRDMSAYLPRPEKELKGFKKISLEPGEEKTVQFTLDKRSFAFYDPIQKDWIIEPGEFEILVGASSRDIRLKTNLLLK